METGELRFRLEKIENLLLQLFSEEGNEEEEETGKYNINKKE